MAIDKFKASRARGIAKLFDNLKSDSPKIARVRNFEHAFAFTENLIATITYGTIGIARTAEEAALLNRA